MTADRRTLLMEAAEHVLAAMAFELAAERVYIADLGETNAWLKKLAARTLVLRRTDDGGITLEVFVATKETPLARGFGKDVEAAFESLLRDAASRRREDAEVCKARASHAA